MRTQWVFMEACGCPFGVLEGSCAADEIDAWMDFYDDNRQEIRKARERGIQVEHVSHDGYVKYFSPKMQSEYACPHKPAAATA
jgi:hypothetical protein